jgi:membrane protein insertase Oxa1/YidC/SpoIIIJ|tara:strand:+ start:11379 stop:11783 length:405 start_codon:yes stop_codon:yes gene_type:complete
LKTFFSALFGFIFSLFVEGFSRIIISFFHKQDFYFFGVESLPTNSWIVIIYIVSFMATWLGVMLAQSIADPESKKAFNIFTLIITCWLTFEILASIKVVPIWYLTTFPFTSVFGLLAAKFTYSLNKSHNAIPSS